MVSPFYEFTITDDAFYSITVKDYINTGKLVLWRYSVPNYVLFALYGALFAKIFGFSFGILKFSVLLLSIFGVVGMYLLLKQLKFQGVYCIFGALFLLVNPIYYNLSHTFMTDVPFLVVTIFALLFYIKGINDGSDKFLLLGSVFSIMSFLIRQYGALTILAVVLYLKLYRRKELFTFNKLFILILLPAFLYALSWYWFISQDVHAKQDINTYAAMNISTDAFWGMLNLGMYLFPFAILYLANWSAIIKSRKQLYAFIAIMAGILIFYTYKIFTEIPSPTGTWYSAGSWSALPQKGPWINTIGIGMVWVGGERAKMFPDPLWVLITILSFIVIFFMALFVLNKYKNLIKEILLPGKKLSHEIPFIYISGIVYLIFLFKYGGIWDRYLLIYMPILISVFLESIGAFKYTKIFLVASLLIFGFWSVAYTDDNMKANNAKWEGINYLLNNGVPPEEIAWAGDSFAFQYLLNYSIQTTEDMFANPSKYKNETRPIAFFYPNATYAISFSKFDDYTELYRDIEYYNIFGKNHMYILKREQKNG